MATINVNPDVLERTAVRLSQAASEIDRLTSRVDRTKGCVESGWKSEYTGLYTAELDVLRRNIQKLASNTNQISESMKNLAVQIRHIEEENRRILSGISVGESGGGSF